MLAVCMHDIHPTAALIMSNEAGEHETEAGEYLQAHHIPQLLEQLTAALVYNRPGAARRAIDSQHK